MELITQATTSKPSPDGRKPTGNATIPGTSQSGKNKQTDPLTDPILKKAVYN